MTSTETNADQLPAWAIKNVLTDCVRLITGNEPVTKFRESEGFCLMVIRPECGMRSVVGTGGRTIKAIQTLATYMAKNHGLQGFKVVLRDPEPSDDDQAYPAMRLNEREIEGVFSALIVMLRKNPKSKAAVVVEGAECLISFERPTLPFISEVSVLATAMAAGLERHSHMPSVDRYTIK